MGGFHGGQSGGGSSGFHGGSHHSSSHHSSSSSHYSSHSVINGKHYINGKRYYGAYYGMSGNRPMRFGGIISIGIVLLAFGLFLFFFIFKVSTTATITKTWDNGIYELYDFEYEFNGKKYHGYGDDDFDSSNNYTINVGEKYTLYVSPTNPSDYDFESNNGLGIFCLLFIGGIGVLIIANAIRTKIKHNKELQLVGDINKDGIINDKDLEYADAINSGKNEGAYKASKENAYMENKIYRRCPHCDSILDENAKFCSNCGSNLKE